jgi:serine kinase of HPr protein (carbohydrate metabolism regulator)
MATAAPTELHATLVDWLGRGILLRGGSGTGKSDLALRLVDAGAQLVADDRVQLHLNEHGVVMGRAPAALAGLIEVRGIGIFRTQALAEAKLSLVVELVPAGQVERLPEPRTETLLGVAIPLVALAPFHPSAAAALKLVVTATAVSGALA